MKCKISMNGRPLTIKLPKVKYPIPKVVRLDSLFEKIEISKRLYIRQVMSK